MAKDEEHIINEWIIYHILLGIEHIYLFDDNSKIPITETVSILPKWILEKVTIYRLEEEDSNYFNENFVNSKYYDNMLHNKLKEYKQTYFLNYFLFNHRTVSKWCFSCDVDEFLYLNNNTNIHDFLQTVDMHNIIYIPWLIYGSSYHIDKPKGLVIDNFRYHDKSYSEAGKSIFKISSVTSIVYDIHKINSKDENFFRYNYKEKLFELPIHINHYQINAVKTYLKRKLRENIGQQLGTIRPASDFFYYIKSYNDIKRNIMDKYIEPINKILNQKKDHIIDDNDLLNIFCINNNIYIYECNTYELLYDMLNNNTLRYCKASEICEKLLDNFNTTNYRIMNNDIKHYTNRELIMHYLLYGKNENREYKCKNLPDDFNSEIYISINRDLCNYNELDAKIHYEKHGFYENRKYKYEFVNIPDDFNAKIYTSINRDLCNFNEIEAKIHYDNHGYYEKRKYKFVNIPDDFNAKIYISINYDLANYNELEATNHYEKYGFYEKRKYK